MNKLVNILTFSTIIAFATVSPASSLEWKDFDVFNRNSGAREGLRNIDPTNKNSAVREAGRQIDRYRIEGLESGVRLCQIAGYDKCIDPNFIQTYAYLKTAANARLIDSADSCGGLVDTAINGGKQGLQIYAMANGAAVPPELANLGAGYYKEHGMLSCKVMYGRLPNGSNLARTNIDGTLVTVPKGKIEEFQQISNQIQNVETPTQKPNSQASQSTSEQNNQNQNNSTEQTQKPAEEEKSDGFRIQW